MLAFRDIVYYEPHTKEWKLTLLNGVNTIRTAFGEVKIVQLQKQDGVLICTLPDGKNAYINVGSAGWR